MPAVEEGGEEEMAVADELVDEVVCVDVAEALLGFERCIGGRCILRLAWSESVEEEGKAAAKSAAAAWVSTGGVTPAKGVVSPPSNDDDEYRLLVLRR